MRNRIFGLTAVVVLSAVTAFAQAPTPVGGELFVGSYPSGYPRQIAVDVDSSGGFVVAWAKGPYGSETPTARRFSSAGAGGAEIDVHTGTYSPSSDAVDVAIDDSGNFVVVWGGSGPYGGSETNAKIFQSGGSMVGPLTVGYGSPDVAAVSMNKDTGDFVVAWTEGYSYGYVQKYSAAGSPIGSTYSFGSFSNFPVDLDVAMDRSGNFVVTWIESSLLAKMSNKAAKAEHAAPNFTVNATGNGPFGSSFSSDATSVTPIASDFAIGTGVGSDPSIAPVGSGNFVVAWSESLGYCSDDVKASVFDSSGNMITTPALNVDQQTGQQVTPAVAGNGSHFVVTWESQLVCLGKTLPSPNQDGSGSAVVGQLFDSSGGALGGEFIVNTTTTGYQYAPAVGMNGSGNFVVGWASNVAYPALVNAQMFATALPVLTVSDVAVTEGNAGTVNATFTVTLTPSFTGTVTVDYATADGTATAGSDYTALSATTLTFLPGETSKLVTVSVLGDTTIETNETFFLNLSNPTNATIADPQGLGTITNDDSVACGTGAATNLSPSGGEVSSPVTFSWTGVSSASFYEVYVRVNGGPLTLLGLTRDTTLTKPVSSGAIEWQVVTEFGPGCRSSRSAFSSVTVTGPPPPPPPPPPACGISEKPLPSVVAESTTGESYRLSWTEVAGSSSYQVQESLNESFSGASTFSVTGLSINFKHPGIETATPYHYRIRGVADCDSTKFGPYSVIIRVVNLPKPVPSSTNPQVVTEFGNQELVSTQLFIPGFGTSAKRGPLAASFTVSSNELWLTPNPVQGELPPGGTTVELVADPTKLELGANMATITVTRNDGLGKTTHGSSTSSVPVSVSLVSPITPLGKETGPPANTLFIPAVANVGGINSKWLSDVRISNAANASIQYQLTFTATEQDGTVEGKKTGYTIRPGQTVAMDDIVRQWFGFGDLADGTNGTLEIRPLNFQGKSADPEATLAATVATSRTYTRDANSLASFGQLMPSVPFSSFIGSTIAGARLSMQQVSQDQFSRTNIGLVEGAGKSVSVLLTVFDRLGTQLGQFPVSLLAGEHRQLNQLLAQNNISVVDGRVEATVTGGDGSITAYASVVSSGTGDPTLVRGIDPSTISANKYVLAGVADLSNGGANWRSDVRIFNGSGVAQLADLYFYPQGSTTPVGPFAVTIGPNEVKVLESVVKTQFGLENTGGAMHIVTPNNSSLVITGETFDVNEDGKYGQTIPSVTVAEAVGTADRPLQLLQLEDSAQYRTNLGLAELTGKPVTVQVQLIIPLSLAAPVTTVQLGANEFKQLNGVIRTLAKRDVYNARIAVKVTGGEGKILAYGSVVDNKTLDATYVPGQ